MNGQVHIERNTDVKDLKYHQAFCLAIAFAGLAAQLLTGLGRPLDRRSLRDEVSVHVAGTKNAVPAVAIEKLRLAKRGLEKMRLASLSAHRAVQEELVLREQGKVPKIRLTREAVSNLGWIDIGVRNKPTVSAARLAIGLGGASFLFSVILYGLTGQTKYAFA